MKSEYDIRFMLEVKKKALDRMTSDFPTAEVLRTSLETQIDSLEWVLSNE